jgi:2'-5' RNA ligase
MVSVDANYSRLFLALELPVTLISQLMGCQRDYPHANIRWQALHNYHLTLHFLGQVAYPTAQALCQQLSEQAQHWRAPDLLVTSIGPFPPSSQPLVLAAHLALNPVLLNLYYGLQTILQELGFEQSERPYLPHITLARLPKPRPAMLPSIPVALPAATCQVLQVYQSQLSAQGARYDSVLQVALPS